MGAEEPPNIEQFSTVPTRPYMAAWAPEFAASGFTTPEFVISELEVKVVLGIKER